MRFGNLAKSFDFMLSSNIDSEQQNAQKLIKKKVIMQKKQKIQYQNFSIVLKINFLLFK